MVIQVHDQIRGFFGPSEGLRMSIPKVQPLLLPVLRALADGTEHESKEIRDRVAQELRLTSGEQEEIHPKSGLNVYVNRVAFALAYLNMGKAITKKREGMYQIAERGKQLLECGVSDLTINEAWNA
jgi:restriction system protein